jgi:hypothetical protein
LPPHWGPSPETFIQWLIHHQIAVRHSRDTYIAGIAAKEFAELPDRLLAYNVGRLILVREGHKEFKKTNYFPGR